MKVVVVGDTLQAIYAFTGADHEALHSLGTQLKQRQCAEIFGVGGCTRVRGWVCPTRSRTSRKDQCKCLKNHFPATCARISLVWVICFFVYVVFSDQTSCESGKIRITILQQQQQQYAESRLGDREEAAQWAALEI